MDCKQFIEKYHLVQDNYCSTADIEGFMNVMQYLYLTSTKEQVSDMAANFYDYADEIYNSLKAYKELLIDKI